MAFSHTTSSARPTPLYGLLGFLSIGYAAVQTSCPEETTPATCAMTPRLD
jgi:hypothetical protein